MKSCPVRPGGCRPRPVGAVGAGGAEAALAAVDRGPLPPWVGPRGVQRGQPVGLRDRDQCFSLNEHLPPTDHPSPLAQVSARPTAPPAPPLLPSLGRHSPAAQRACPCWPGAPQRGLGAACRGRSGDGIDPGRPGQRLRRDPRRPAKMTSEAGAQGCAGGCSGGQQGPGAGTSAGQGAPG